MSRGSAVWAAVLCVLTLALLLWPQPSQAHGRDTSYSSWRTLEGHDWELALRLSGRDYARLGGAGPALAAIELGACTPDANSLVERSLPGGERLLRWTLRCPESASELELGALFEQLGPAHVHRLEREGLPGEEILTITRPRASLTRPEAGSALRFLVLGLAHIAGGWDHLAFVLALLLGARSLGGLALLVTGFSVGHSLTLGLAGLGLAQPHGGAIELLIAASIVIVAAGEQPQARARARGCVSVTVTLGLVALLAASLGRPAESLATAGAALFAWGYLSRGPRSAERSKDSSVQLAMVVGFGLIHGAGFAGFLQDTGLPPGARISSLLAFNLGVELGQLAFVALAWPLLMLVRRRGLRPEPWAGLGLVGLGTAWVYLRALG